MQCPDIHLFMSNTTVQRRNQQVERHLDLAQRLARSFPNEQVSTVTTSIKWRSLV